MGDFPKGMGAGRGRQSPLATASFNLSAALAAESTELDFTSDPVRAIEVGGAGNLVYQLWEDAVPVTLAVAPGKRVTGYIRKVIKAGTTATNLIGLR